MVDLDATRLHEARLAVDLHGHGRARRQRHRLASGDTETAASGVQDCQVEVVDGDQLQETVVHLRKCNFYLFCAKGLEIPESCRC